jgi:hypothetical protein
MTQPTTSAVRGAPSAVTDPYVINLCASTTPMALSRPTAPELARFTFFVSRRREEGRERFRLHMGYFATRDEAEQLLSLIRDLYPAAWVGEAPGKRLAQRAEGAATAAAKPPAPPPPAAAAKSPVAKQPAAKQSAPKTPGAHARPAAPASAAPAVAAPTAVAPTSPAANAAAPSAPSRVTVPVAPPAAAAARTAVAPERRAVPRTAPPRVPPSNVREVLDSLDAAPAATPRPAQPAVPATPAATASAPPAPRPASPPRVAAAPQASSAAPQSARPAPVAPPPAATAAQAPQKRAELSDCQVLRILETRSANAVAQSAAAPAAVAPRSETDIRMLSPEDTQTWRDIKSQLSRDAAVHFAVQLEWSVSPIDLDRVPPLAIFNAYTLYKIEGNRDGRKWYGLRLGFFSDAVAARQVALYIRSEFATVAVVPVSAKERGDATQVGAIELSQAIAPAVAKEDDAIELIDDAVDAALSRSQQPLADPEAVLASEPVAAAPPAAVDAAAPRRQGRPRGSPQTLEETLEILGASQLSIDNGTGVRLDLGSGARRSEPRNSTFSKLLDRLSEKLRG